MGKKRLKKFWSRQLRGGDYVFVAHNASPIFVETSIAAKIIEGDTTLLENDSDIKEIFQSNSFFHEGCDSSLELHDKKTFLRDLLRYGLLFVGIGVLLGVFALTFVTGIPTGNMIIPSSVSLIYVVTFILAFRIAVALIHEFMHMVYGETLRLKRGGMGFDLKKGVFFVSMNHVWTWSLLSRVAALSAGIVSDLLILLTITILRFHLEHWILDSAAAIMWAQIIWQFQFNTKCDGQLLVLTILDEPFIHIDAKKRDAIKTRNYYIWKVFSLIGYASSAILMLFWIFPFVIDFVRALFMR